MFISTTRSVRVALFSMATVVALKASAQTATPPTARASGGLARAEFDKPVSIQMTGVAFLRAFAALSQQLGVPLVIDFDEKAELLVTVVAKDVPGRTILAGLGKTYDLEYTASDQGVIVTRKGADRPVMPIVVGEWPPVPDVPYDVQFALINPAGQILASPTWTTLSGHLTAIKQGFEGGESVMQLDRKLGRLEPHNAGGIEVAFFVLREIGPELQMLVELTTDKAVTENTYSAVHTAVKVLAPNRQTVLLKTPDGYEVRLLSWRRSLGAPTR